MDFPSDEFLERWREDVVRSFSIDYRWKVDLSKLVKVGNTLETIDSPRFLSEDHDMEFSLNLSLSKELTWVSTNQLTLSLVCYRSESIVSDIPFMCSVDLHTSSFDGATRFGNISILFFVIFSC